MLVISPNPSAKIYIKKKELDGDETIVSN